MQCCPQVATFHLDRRGSVLIWVPQILYPELVLITKQAVSVGTWS